MASRAVLLDRVDRALMANGGPNFNQLFCQCDTAAGMVPCQYCAIHDALVSVREYLLAAGAAGAKP